MADSWELEPGDTIDDGLHVVERLGGGKQHEVVLATDDRRLSTVVVKLLRPDQRTEFGLTILREEAARLDAVRHPAFPRLLELVVEGERPHLVMEHVQGPRLSRLVRRYGPLAFEQLVPLAVDVLGAVHYLHGLGLVHLDIKPGNLVLSDRVRVVDLGLARRVEEAKRLRRRLGTVSWMAPEQHRPEDGRVGPAADVWAWGAVLVFAASGDWAPTRFRREGGEDWVLRPEHLEQVTVPDPLPDALAAAIRDALAWRPEDRPSPGALARRLEPVVDSLPTKPVLSRLRPKFTDQRIGR